MVLMHVLPDMSLKSHLRPAPLFVSPGDITFYLGLQMDFAEAYFEDLGPVRIYHDGEGGSVCIGKLNQLP